MNHHGRKEGACMDGLEQVQDKASEWVGHCSHQGQRQQLQSWFFNLECENGQDAEYILK